MPFKGPKAFIEIHQREYDIMCFRGWQPRSLFPEPPDNPVEPEPVFYDPGMTAEIRNLEKRLNEHLDYQKQRQGTVY
jgi:hypothetical protein